MAQSLELLLNDSDEENMGGLGGVSSDDEAHDQPRVRNISVRTGVLDEKAAATQALAMFALHTKKAYSPYLDETLRILIKHLVYFHEDVRLQAIISMKHTFMAAEAIFQSDNEGPTKIRGILDTLMEKHIFATTNDEDKELVAQVCTNIAEIMKEYGYSAIEPYIGTVVNATLNLLHEEGACQQAESDSDLDDDVDNEHEEILMDAVSDLLPAFTKCMGSHFAPTFSSLFDALMKFAKASRPPQDRTMVVTCLAEVAQNMGAPIAGYVDRIMPLVPKELSSSEATNRRNAAFCIGELCKIGGEPTLKYPFVVDGFFRQVETI